MNKVLRATLVSAVVITTIIGAASFVLSFAALWDLATLAGVPRELSWLWPVIVDGTILQATISVIALAQFDDQRGGRKFFWWVLVTAALVSIGANALHAFISQAGSLYPALSAVIATVAPVSLLAATHGLGILVRIPVVVENDERRPVPIAEPVQADSWGDTPRAAQSEPEELPQAVPTGSSGASVMTIAHEIAPHAMVAHDHRDAVPPERSVASVDVAGLGVANDPLASNPLVDDPLDDVDRWMLDRNSADDLYPVDAP